MARAKAPSLAWREASAETLPFDAAVFDDVLYVLSIHYFTDLPAAFAGIYRVLRPGDRAAIFNAIPEQVRRY
ncbi:MAG: methyltransferase domain-containing protein [Pseudomonadota bacterium]|nr:methyltransferase domain-containing protein [Pseudomonadota bacterium]